jgi:cytochrome bd-type quinol oxidase subunit 2
LREEVQIIRLREEVQIIRLREEAQSHRGVIHRSGLGMSSFPVLSIITWSPFVGALLIMFLARRHARLVRWFAVVSTSVSLVLSVAV